MATRVLVVDDHAGFRSFAQRLLSAAGFVVVGEVGNGADAVAASERLRPDAVLLDVQLPDLDGFEVARGSLSSQTRPTLSSLPPGASATSGSRDWTARACGDLWPSPTSPDRL